MTPQDQGDPTRSMPPVGGDSDASGPGEKRASSAHPGAVPTGGALLTVVSGELEADYFVLTGEEAYIGRSPESSVLLDDVTVSRQHAKITRDDKGWLITDLRSLNGTYLNKERVDSGALSDGDELQIGKFRFVFVVPEVTSG